MLRSCLILTLCCALGLSPARADTLHVPQDFATIQAALDAAAADDVILIKSGLYAESVTASLPANVTIQAQGNVRLDASGLGAALTVDGQDLQVIGLRVIGGTDGIVVGGTDALVLRCTVSDVAGRGIVVAGLQVKLDKCKIFDSGGDGIAIEDGNAVVVKKCRVVDAQGNGLTIAATPAGTFILKSRIVRPGLDGIVNDGGGGVVVSSRIVDAGGRGLVDNAQSPAHNSAYISCQVVRPAGDGILSTGDKGPQIQSCKITHPGATGIDVAGNLAQVKHCKVKAAGGNGLHIAGTDGIWNSNSCRDATQNGFVLDGTGNTLSLNVGKGSDGFDLLDNQPGLNLIAADNEFGTVGP